MVELKKYTRTKSELFTKAINTRNEVRFIYNLRTVNIHPYYISKNKYGRKVLYGRLSNSQVIEKFEFKYMVNIKILSNKRFSPIIPIVSLVS